MIVDGLNEYKDKRIKMAESIGSNDANSIADLLQKDIELRRSKG